MPAERRAGLADDRSDRADQALRRHPGRRRRHLRRPARRGHRLPRAERVGQVDHDAADHGPRRPHRGRRDHQRSPLPRPPLAVAGGRRPPRGPGHPPGPERPCPPADARRDQRHRERARRGGARPGGADGGRRAPGGQVLAGHGPTARDRRRPPRRPRRPPVRRAGQRSRPRWHPLGPQSPQGAGPGGAHRVRVEPPHERDGAHRRRGGDHRARPPDRPGVDRRPARTELAAFRAGPLTGRRRPGAGARAGGGDGDVRRRRLPDGAGAGRAGHRRAGGDRPGGAARALAPVRVARGGVHGAHRGQRGVPGHGGTRRCRWAWRRRGPGRRAASPPRSERTTIPRSTSRIRLRPATVFAIPTWSNG